MFNEQRKIDLTCIILLHPKILFFFFFTNNLYFIIKQSCPGEISKVIKVIVKISRKRNILDVERRPFIYLLSNIKRLCKIIIVEQQTLFFHLGYSVEVPGVRRTIQSRV